MRTKTSRRRSTGLFVNLPNSGSDTNNNSIYGGPYQDSNNNTSDSNPTGLFSKSQQTSIFGDNTTTNNCIENPAMKLT